MNEKLETIKAKRQEDRNKLKEFEKMKIMFEQVSARADWFNSGRVLQWEILTGKY